MNIEEEIFKNYKLNKESLISYGFINENNKYLYTKEFMDYFKAIITINEEGSITGKVIDLKINDEYFNFRVKNQIGEFVSSIRKLYQDILIDIRDNCYIKTLFDSSQANRITNYIINKYHNEPEFLWEKTPYCGVFRHDDNNKWYAVIISIDKSKIDKEKCGEVEIINLKLNKDKVKNLIGKKGIYEAYHMNKKHWVSIILDNTLEDEDIIKYVDESFKNTQ